MQVFGSGRYTQRADIYVNIHRYAVYVYKNGIGLKLITCSEIGPRKGPISLSLSLS